jgi:outer membrane protein OmpU
VKTFGDFNVAVSGRYGTATAAGRANPDLWSAGLNLGHAGFKIGGSYAEQNDAGIINREAYDLGASYETGPWGLSFTWFYGENVGSSDSDGAAVPTFTAAIGDEEIDQFLLGISYQLAKGAALNGFGAYVDFDDDNGDLTREDVEAFVVGSAIRVDF